ncbi:unnamed protein product [Alternaria alternata]
MKPDERHTLDDEAQLQALGPQGYHWVAVITPRKWVPLASFITGWINVSGWLALTTSGGLLASQLISGLIALYHPNFTLHPWQVWLIYVAWTIIAFIINAFMNNLLPYVNRGAFIWSIGEFVFTEFINETGWPDGIAWLLGLLQGGFGLTGYDAVAHMIEEIPNAAVEGPKIMIYCVCIGTVTGFIFLMVLLFVSGGDAESIISAAPGPLLQILKMLGPRAFVLPGPFGWIANLIGIAYTIVTTVLFLFPPELPVSASSMNYCVVAFGIILFISTFQWFVDGRKNFTGPRADVGLEVLEAMKSHEPTDATAQHSKAVDGGKDLT